MASQSQSMQRKSYSGKTGLKRSYGKTRGFRHWRSLTGFYQVSRNLPVTCPSSTILLCWWSKGSDDDRKHSGIFALPFSPQTKSRNLDSKISSLPLRLSLFQYKFEGLP